MTDKIIKTEAFSRRHLQKEKVKVRILKMHVAYIEKRIIDDLREYCGIEDFNEWFKEQIEKDFTVVINDKYDISSLTAIVRKRYYENIAEWVKERARKELLQHSPHTIFKNLDGRERDNLY